MNLKLNFLDSHIDNFPQNLGDYSEEYGERFHQDFKEMEDRYQGRWDKHMMAEYCWTLKRDIPLCSTKIRNPCEDLLKIRSKGITRKGSI